jgi:ribose-phosphate pyrophosphokinase
MANLDDLRVFTGNAHPSLAKDVCSYLGISHGEAQVFKFSNNNTFVQYQENIRERDVFIIQPAAYPVNDSLMELLIMIDAAKRASARRITAVLPYYAYGRTDKKDQPRVPITARLVADLITVAGANRVLTMDLHAGQIQGFFDIPVDELSALNLFTQYFREKELVNPVVVAVDIGISKRARNMAERLQVPLAIIEKRRVGNSDNAYILNIIGEVAGKTAIAFDDETDTAGSLVSAVSALTEADVREVYACSTHAVLSAGAVERVEASPIKELVLTDTLPLNSHLESTKIRSISIAATLGEAIRRIHLGESVGAMFLEG